MVTKKMLKQSEVSIILAFIKEKIPCIQRIGLTGSYATGEQSPQSDLDIIVDVKQEEIPAFWEVAEEIREILINNFLLPVDFIFYDTVVRKSLTKSCWLSTIQAEMYEEMLSKVRWLEEGVLNAQNR